MKKYVGSIEAAMPMMGYDPSTAGASVLAGSPPKPIEGYLVTFAGGFTTWMPREAFESNFAAIEGMTFGMALEEVKAGKKIARKGWNGRGMWLQAQFPDDDSLMTRPYLFMVLPFGSSNQFGDDARDIDRVPWLASQTDIFATDWFVKEE